METIAQLNNWLINITELGLAAAVVFSILALLVKRLRGSLALYLLILSYGIGTATWILCAVTVYDYWGIGGFVIGLLFAGVGVVPLSLLAALLHGNWMTLSAIVIQVALTFGTRIGSLTLARKVDEAKSLEQQYKFEQVDGVWREL
jgi:tetrahydromethanopterin S-methyltransferase subunit F